MDFSLLSACLVLCILPVTHQEPTVDSNSGVLIPPKETFGGLVGEVVDANATTGASGNASTSAAGGGEAGGADAKPMGADEGLIPVKEGFGHYLKEASGGKPEEGGSAGDAEEPIEPGEPKWAPKCPADYKPAEQKPAALPEATGAPANCVDKHPLCPFWGTRGWCKKGPAYMKEHCLGVCDSGCTKKFLQFEPGQCVDKRENCKELVAAGHCAITPFFMVWQCPLSCLFCQEKKEPFVIEYSVKEFTCAH